MIPFSLTVEIKERQSFFNAVINFIAFLYIYNALNRYEYGSVVSEYACSVLYTSHDTELAGQHLVYNTKMSPPELINRNKPSYSTSLGYEKKQCNIPNVTVSY